MGCLDLPVAQFGDFPVLHLSMPEQIESKKEDVFKVFKGKCSKNQPASCAILGFAMGD